MDELFPTFSLRFCASATCLMLDNAMAFKETLLTLLVTCLTVLTKWSDETVSVMKVRMCGTA